LDHKEGINFSGDCTQNS